MRTRLEVALRIAAKLAMTVIVKAMDTQRWICRTHLFMESSRAGSLSIFQQFFKAINVLRPEGAVVREPVDERLIPRGATR